MLEKIIESDFGRFTFLDEHAVVATANSGVNIDAEKVQQAVDIIERELPGDYVIILDRKVDYSVMPLEVYKYFASVDRLKALAIVSYRDREFLPNNMERRIYAGRTEKFSCINDAHDWVKKLFE